MRGLTDVASGWRRRGLRCWGADPGSRPLPPSGFGDFDPTRRGSCPQPEPTRMARHVFLTGPPGNLASVRTLHEAEGWAWRARGVAAAGALRL